MPLAPNDEHTHPWFIDRDDGTVIHLFASGFVAAGGNTCPIAHVAFEQNVTLGECDLFDDGGFETVPLAPGCPIGSVRKNRLEFKDPLPDDFAFASGSISRFDDRLSMFLEEWTPSRVGEPTILAGQQLLPMRTFITRYDFVNKEVLGISDGSATQIFALSGNDILTPTKGTPIIFVDGGRWTLTDDLQSNGPNDQVFLYNPTTGDVIFGNGVNGQIPPDGDEIVLKITIRDGGGQWEFVDIIVAPKDNTNIGNVKSVEDKIFYSQSEPCMASQSGFTTVTNKVRTGTLNFYNKKIENEPPARLLLNKHVYS
ncbi:hypothetical protein LCGC14_1212790, partial [marine sediment metagenome]